MAIEESSQLIRRAKAGSNEALDVVFERYGRKLLGLIRLRLGPSLRNQLESRDVLQATLLKAFQKIDQLEGSGSRSLMAWLGVIAQNEIRDQADFHRRKRRDVARNVPVEEGFDDVESRIRSEASRLHFEAQAERLERALETLSDRHREVTSYRTRLARMSSTSRRVTLKPRRRGSDGWRARRGRTSPSRPLFQEPTALFDRDSCTFSLTEVFSRKVSSAPPPALLGRDF